MSESIAAEHEDMFPPLGEESLGVVHGKVGMWTFLVMDAMTFAGFLAGYARLRWGVGSGMWPGGETPIAGWLDRLV